MSLGQLTAIELRLSVLPCKSIQMYSSLVCIDHLAKSVQVIKNTGVCYANLNGSVKLNYIIYFSFCFHFGFINYLFYLRHRRYELFHFMRRRNCLTSTSQKNILRID